MATTIIINSVVWDRIYEFYSNVSKKYPNTWDINDTIAQINEIEIILKKFEEVSQWSRVPKIPYWKEKGWQETWLNNNPWHFAFNKIISSNEVYIYINDTEHQENIHESLYIENNQNKTYKTMNRIRLTESQLHNVIRRCINEALDEISPEFAHKAANAAMEKSSQNGDKKSKQAEKFANYAAQGVLKRNQVASGNGMTSGTMSVTPYYEPYYKTYNYDRSTMSYNDANEKERMDQTRNDLHNLGQSEYGNEKMRQDKEAYQQKLQQAERERQQKIAELQRKYGPQWKYYYED